MKLNNTADRQAGLPPSQQLHLKAQEAHDHNKPTLCGRDDPGVYTYAVVCNQFELEKLKSESESEPYPLCPACERRQRMAFQGITEEDVEETRNPTAWPV